MLVRPVPDITTMGLTELIMTLLLIEVNLYRYVSANKPLSTQMLEKIVQPKEVNKAKHTKCNYTLKKHNGRRKFQELAMAVYPRESPFKIGFQLLSISRPEIMFTQVSFLLSM